MAKKINRKQRMDIIGDTYGKLLVIEEVFGHENTYVRKFKCQCECGNITIANMGNLRKKNHTTSCGCHQKEKAKEANTKHGHSKHALFHTYYDMVDRCHNERNISYENYGGRGIKVCDRWREESGQGFVNFITDMGEKPKKYTLERKDNDLDYSPENCIWQDRTGQILNRRILETKLSRYRGVGSYNEKWIARCRHPQIDGEYQPNVYIGIYDTEIEAALAYDAYVVSKELPNKINFEVIRNVIDNERS